MDALTILIFPASEGGYMYEIYDHDHGDRCLVSDACVSNDGGLCTTTMQSALGMATEQAEDLIKQRKGVECPGCGADMTDMATVVSTNGHGSICHTSAGEERTEGDFIGDR